MSEYEQEADCYIAALRNLSPHIEYDCLHGGCYRLYKLLKLSFPDALAYMSAERDHVVTRIGDGLYDITGRVGSWKSGRYHLMDDAEHRVASRWRVRRR